MVLIDNEYQIDICMKIFNKISNSYCNFTIDDAIEIFNKKQNGFNFFLDIFMNEICYFISLSPNPPGIKPAKDTFDTFDIFIKQNISEYREIILNKILNDKLK